MRPIEKSELPQMWTSPVSGFTFKLRELDNFQLRNAVRNQLKLVSRAMTRDLRLAIDNLSPAAGEEAYHGSLQYIDLATRMSVVAYGKAYDPMFEALMLEAKRRKFDPFLPPGVPRAMKPDKGSKARTRLEKLAAAA